MGTSPGAAVSDAIVSHDSESLILVDADDRVIGHAPKQACHEGDGLLHRAFSVFIFNSAGEVMLQQRSEQKMLWPGYWANSCCSHPRKGEEVAEAAHRRVFEELGIRCNLRHLYRFQYHARYGDVGSENELCSVFIGKSNEKILPNINEIAQWRFISAEQLNREIEDDPERFAPWFKMEWARLQDRYRDEIAALCKE